ncbi:MAG: hypothetical protein AAGE52_30780 [Myxococcota bacterium]
MREIDDLPGAWLIKKGLDDLERGARSAESLAVSAASTRLRHLGFDVPRSAETDPQLALYLTLGESGVEDPYGRYNAMLRELSSFLEAAEGRRRRALQAGEIP